MATNSCTWTGTKLPNGDEEYHTHCGTTLVEPASVPMVANITGGFKTCHNCRKPILIVKK